MAKWNYPLIFAVVVIVSILGYVIVLAPQPLTFKVDLQTQFLALMGSLFAVAVFMERSLEVFVAVSRTQGAADLDEAIEQREERERFRVRRLHGPRMIW